MSVRHDADANARQYGDSRKLAARARLFGSVEADIPWPVWVATEAAFAPGERVLEVGCGPGWFWGAAADALPADLDLTLTDLSPGMVEEAAAKVTGLRRHRVASRVADVSNLPFDDASFDAVLAMHMFYHVPDPALGMAEVARVLKPGGRAIVTTNGRGDMHEIYALGAAAFGGPAVNPAALAFGFDEARAIMEAAFGKVTSAPHPARLRLTDAGMIFDALTSFPPGEGASEGQQGALRTAIADALARSGGVLDVAKETAVFVGRKAR